MDPLKQEYTQKAVHLIKASCRLMTEEAKEPTLAVLKLSPNNLEKIIAKIMIELPDHQLHNASHLMRQDILSFIVKNFLFFEAQEDINSNTYKHHLLGFITCLSAQIDARYYPKNILFKKSTPME